MKVFVTGGNGFIGRNLKEQLGERYVICSPTSAELNLIDERAVLDYIKKHSFDAVVHAATWNATRNSTKDGSKVLENNLRMFFNIARCSGSFGKMIYYGSGAEYDRRHWIPGMKEEYFDAHVPADAYGFSKYLMTKYTEYSKNIYNLRLFGVFGKYEDWEIRFISNACCKAARDLPITIKQNVFFDYLSIDDVVSITEWFLGHEAKDRCYNVCAGKAVDLLSFAKMVLKAAGKQLPISVGSEGLGTEYSGDNGKLLQEIKKYSFKDTTQCIDELYHWYVSTVTKIDKNKLLFDK
jgi:UDP-glucose 4-epimerase